MIMVNSLSTISRIASSMISKSKNVLPGSGIRSADGTLLYPMKNGPRGYNNILGGNVVYNKLIENEVKEVFLYTGGSITPLIDALYSDERIKYYMNAHELSAGYAAITYAKSTGRVGVSIITSDSGHGLINSITTLTNATNNNIPFVLFSGNVALSRIITNAFRKCSATEITQPITKWSYCVKSVDELPDVVDEAFRFAQDGNPGAIHIDLPKCVTSDRFKNNGRRFRFDHKYTIDDVTAVD